MARRANLDRVCGFAPALAAISLAIACDAASGGFEHDVRSTEEPIADVEPERAEVSSESDSPRRDTEPPLGISARGRRDLGPDVAAIEELYALEARAYARRESSGPVIDAIVTRDDDLETGWVCDSRESSACVVRLQLPEPAQVSALRLQGWATDPDGIDPSVAGLDTVRVAIAGEAIEVRLPPTSAETYVQFASPVSTEALEIELADGHGAPSHTLLTLAEVEVFGTLGAPRMGLDLDPSASFVSLGEVPWTEPDAADETELENPVIGFVDETGQRRHWVHGSALHGERGDDYLLIERVSGTDCVETSVEYVLVDQRTRMFYSVARARGAATTVYRHRRGRGFLIGHVGAAEIHASGMTEVAGQLRPLSSDPRSTPKAQLDAWHIAAEPVARGGHRITDLPTDCRSVTDVPVENSDIEDEFDWVECQLGSSRAYLGTAACGTGWEVVVVDARGDSIDRAGTLDGATRGLRLMRSPAGLLAEIQGTGDHPSRVLRLHDGGIDGLGPGTALAARPPDDCGCSDAFVISHASGSFEPGEYGETC